MSAIITIQLSPSAIALADRFRQSPQEFPQAIKRGMNRALPIVAGWIQEKRLTGHGPFPVSEHRLGERTGQLKLRTGTTPAVVISEGNISTVTGKIGGQDGVPLPKYAAIHEFGGTIYPKQATVERQILTGRKRIRKAIRIPERAPFRTGIRENMDYISGEIEKEIVKSLKQ